MDSLEYKIFGVEFSTLNELNKRTNADPYKSLLEHERELLVVRVRITAKGKTKDHGVYSRLYRLKEQEKNCLTARVQNLFRIIPELLDRPIMR